VPRVFEGKTIAPDPKLAALLDPYLQRVNAKRNEKTGIRTATKLTRSYEVESQVGDLLADALREAGKADIAIINSGGIRADLPAGDLIYRDVFEVAPFDNFVSVVQMTGAELAEALQVNASGDRGLLQVSGIRYVKDKTQDPAHRVTSVTLANGQPLDPNATYRVAMLDFLSNGGDGLLPVMQKIPKDRITVDQNRPFRDVIIDVVSKWPQPISVTTEGRVTVVQPPK
jgi:5'-nucleotidase